MSREHPLLMKGRLVVATLAGRKTQTRRLVTPANSTAYPDALVAIGVRSLAQAWPMLDLARANAHVLLRADNPPTMGWVIPMKDRPLDLVVRPRVEVGDLLWVRETWRTAACLDDDSSATIEKSGHAAGWERGWAPLLYMADGSTTDESMTHDGQVFAGGWGKTRPAIHMPRWACRAVLPVTDVRAERLQDISEEDARAEGIEPGVMERLVQRPHRLGFANLWDEINGKREGARWADNPMLWAYSYNLGGAPCPA